jgi:DNA-directed RNA polymerase subunit E'/Rpb7
MHMGLKPFFVADPEVVGWHRTMFFKFEHKKNIYVQPEELGPQLTHRLDYLLRDAIEGTRIPHVGVVICVTDIINAASLQGKVLETGTVVFAMTYEGIAFRFQQGEVCDGRVVEVSAESFTVDVGATQVRVSRYHIPASYLFDDAGGAPRYAHPDGSISDGSTVRIQIIAETPTNAKYGALGTIAGNYLGVKL